MSDRVPQVPQVPQVPRVLRVLRVPRVLQVLRVPQVPGVPKVPVVNRLAALPVVLLLGALVARPAPAQRPDDSEPQKASRIISLVPALTEMVFEIGGGDAVIAVSSYDDFPPDVRSLPKVGALIDPDVERIIRLRPDLVLLYGSQADLITQLSRASIPYFEYRHGGLADVTATLRALGARTGRTRVAAEVADRIEMRLTRLRDQTKALDKPRTLLVFGRESGSLRNIYASGGRGFLHDMIEAAGGTNIFADVAAESVEASSEMLLTRAPEVIIEIRSVDIPEGPKRTADIAAWNTLASVPAVRTKRIHFVTGRALGVPGPRVADSAEQLATLLHPGLR